MHCGGIPPDTGCRHQGSKQLSVVSPQVIDGFQGRRQVNLHTGSRLAAVITLDVVTSVDSVRPDSSQMNPAPPDALIIGHYGFKNLGDEAILAGMLTLLRDRFPDRRWTVSSGDPEDTRRRHRVAAVDRADLPAVLLEAYRSRMVIVGGGGLLSDQWGFSPEHVLSRDAADIPGYLGPALSAAAAGRPVLVWGVGVGPFHDPSSPLWVKALGEVSSAFTVRTDRDSVDLESLGVADAPVVGDPAWLVDRVDLPPELDRIISDLPRPLVAVAPRRWGAIEVQAEREHKIARALDAFATECGGAVLFVPMQELGSDQFDDRRCCERITELMRHPHTHITPAGLSAGQLITALGRSDMALNMRLHGTILAAMGRTPSVSLSYDPKVARMAAQIGLGPWCVPDEPESWEGLGEALGSLWEDYADQSHLMYEYAESMLRRSRPIVALIETAMREATAPAEASAHEQIQQVMALALTRNLAGTQEELDETQGDNLELSNRLIRESEAARARLQAAHDQHAHAERRGDLLQLELDNLRQTRAIKLVTRYWRLRHRLRRRTAPALPTAERHGLHTPHSPGQPIPPHVADRIAESEGVVVFLPTIEWYIHLFQRPQQLAQAFSRLGYTVIYDNPRQSPPGWDEIAPGLFLYNGPQEALHHLPDPLVWAITYNWEQASRYPEGTRTVYDWIDEIEVFDGHDPNKLRRLHSLGLAGAGMITASARSLLERASQPRPDAIYLPNAVEFEHFADWQLSSPAHPVLQRLLAAGRPIVGYYGAIARWLDYDLLTEVAEMRGDWSFLLIGPPYDQSARRRRLFGLPNVEWIAAQPYGDLPRWLQCFDVAMIPFVVNDITRSTSPLKLFEYFAGGKPVVSSEMPEVVAFREVRSYSDAAGMSGALDLALADSKNPEIRDALRRRGEENSWLARARTVVNSFEEQQGG
ncbi:MAG: glycosyltransferase [Acidimicrobiia bacterium]|nr:glycosyltransferase [Acidimicrobiia bacterium]